MVLKTYSLKHLELPLSCCCHCTEHVLMDQSQVSLPFKPESTDHHSLSLKLKGIPMKAIVVGCTWSSSWGVLKHLREGFPANQKLLYNEQFSACSLCLPAWFCLSTYCECHFVPTYPPVFCSLQTPLTCLLSPTVGAKVCRVGYKTNTNNTLKGWILRYVNYGSIKLFWKGTADYKILRKVS